MKTFFIGGLGVRDIKDPLVSVQVQWLKKNIEKEGRNERVVLNWAPLTLEPGLHVVLQYPRTKKYNVPGKIFR